MLERGKPAGCSRREMSSNLRLSRLRLELPVPVQGTRVGDCGQGQLHAQLSVRITLDRKAPNCHAR